MRGSADDTASAALLWELFEWVRGYALDDIPNRRYYETGGAEIMERVQAYFDKVEGR